MSLDLEQQKTIDAIMASGVAAHDQEAMKLALKKGATPDAFIKRVAANDVLLSRLTPDVLQLALKQGASADLLLFAALEKKVVDVVKLAVEQGGANVNAVRRPANAGSGDCHAVHFAYQCFDKAIFDYLLSRGADLNAPDAEGATVLQREAKNYDNRYGSCDSANLEYLLAKGADPMRKDNAGNFPLRTMQNNTNCHVDDRQKLKMLKLMMANCPDEGPAAATSSKPAQDFATAVTTKDDIEVGKPLELKKKPTDKQFNL